MKNQERTDEKEEGGKERGGEGEKTKGEVPPSLSCRQKVSPCGLKPAMADEQ